jgi:hypothetical protein
MKTKLLTLPSVDRFLVLLRQGKRTHLNSQLVKPAGMFVTFCFEWHIPTSRGQKVIQISLAEGLWLSCRAGTVGREKSKTKGAKSDLHLLCFYELRSVAFVGIRHV